MTQKERLVTVKEGEAREVVLAKMHEERIDALVSTGVDVLLINSSHGHYEGVLQRIRDMRAKYPELPEIIGGNVATGAGAGVPQITTISNAVEALEGAGIPVIADGSIRFSGDIAKAGAASVMVGSLLAGTEESPGEIELF